MKRKYKSEELDYVRKIIKGKSRKEAFELFNKKFEPIKFSQFLSLLSNHKITNDISTTFKKGMIPVNKGTKGMIKANSGSFRRGRETHNKADVGKETVTQEGYVRVKAGQPNIWKQKHRAVWEKEKGKIPEGMYVLFLDSNKLNCNIENLALVTKSELLIINKKRLIHNNAELTSTGLNVAKLIDRVNKVKKGKKGE